MYVGKVILKEQHTKSNCYGMSCVLQTALLILTLCIQAVVNGESAMEVDTPGATVTDSRTEGVHIPYLTPSYLQCPPSPSSDAIDFDQNPVAIERVLAFGRDLQALYTKLTSSKPNEQLKTMLQVKNNSRGH